MTALLCAGTAAAQSPDPAGPPKPDPAPAAVKQQSTPKVAPSSSSSSNSGSSSPTPARTFTPAPVVSPTPSSSSAPPQSSPTPSTTKALAARAAKAKAAKARAARLKAAKAKAARAEAAKAKAAKAKKPVVLAPVRSTPAHAFTPPVDASSKGGSGLNLSDGGVLLVTFLLALGIGVLVLLARAFWRRLSLRRHHRRSHSSPGIVEDVPDTLQWWLHDDTTNGSSGTTRDGAEAITVTPRSGADAPGGR
jgi:hypothetical protein